MHGLLCVSSSSIFSEMGGLSLNLEHTVQAKLSGHQTSGTGPSLLRFPSPGLQTQTIVPALTWTLQIQTQALFSHSKHLTLFLHSKRLTLFSHSKRLTHRAVSQYPWLKSLAVVSEVLFLKHSYKKQVIH